MENHRFVNEPNGNDDGVTTTPDNSAAKDDGRSRNTTWNAGNATQHGQYSEPGKSTEKYISHYEIFIIYPSFL